MCDTTATLFTAIDFLNYLLSKLFIFTVFGPRHIFKINCFLRRAINALAVSYAAMQKLLIDNCCRSNYVIRALRQERAVTWWKHEDYVVSVCCVQLEMFSTLCFDLNPIRIQ